MPVIRISDITWERIKKWAIPLEDTPDTVLNKVLDKAEKGGIDMTTYNSNQIGNKGTRTKRAGITPRSEYRNPMLRVLLRLGGSAPRPVVLDNLFQIMKPIFTPLDLEEYKNGEITWRESASYLRLALVDEGILKSGSPRGIWELSEKGIQEAKKITYLPNR